MDITVEGTNIKVTEEIEAYAREKLNRLDRYLPRIREVEVDLSHERTKRGEDFVSAQITVRHSRGPILRAEERTVADMKKAIDKAVDKMYRQIQRFKGKRNRKGRNRFIATIEELDIAEDIPDVEEYVDEFAQIAAEYEATDDDDMPVIPITRRKDIELNPMTEVEAIEQMELLGHDFFMFFNVDTRTINVIYRREKGDYGILVPMTP